MHPAACSPPLLQALTALSSLIAAARRRPLVAALLLLIVLLGSALRIDKIGTGTRVSVDERSYLGIANNMVVHRSYAYGKDPLHWAPARRSSSRRP